MIHFFAEMSFLVHFPFCFLLILKVDQTVVFVAAENNFLSVVVENSYFSAVAENNYFSVPFVATDNFDLKAGALVVVNVDTVGNCFAVLPNEKAVGMYLFLAAQFLALQHWFYF